jgi:hypothetical protein
MRHEHGVHGTTAHLSLPGDARLENAGKNGGTRPAVTSPREELMLKHVTASIGAVLLASSVAFAGQSSTKPETTSQRPANQSQTVRTDGTASRSTDQIKRQSSKKHRKHHKKNKAKAKSSQSTQSSNSRR